MIKMNSKKEILFDANIIGTDPFQIKELIIRGYKILSVSPISSPKFIVERRYGEKLKGGEENGRML